MAKLVAWVGKAKSGKDTACEEIERVYPGAVRLAFAGALKNTCSDLFGKALGIPRKAFFGSQAEKETDLADYGLAGWTGRTILQHIGTEGFRHIHPDIWPLVTNGLVREASANPACPFVCVSDMRFLSEAEFVRKRGGVIVRLLRNPAGDTNAGIKGHASELEMEKIVPDFVIDNRTGTVEQFLEEVRSVMETINERG